MSYSSSRCSTPTTSPSSSARPIQIGFTPSGTDALLEIFPSSTTSSRYSTCAYPCWPSGSALTKNTTTRRPSAFISDDDLFGIDDAPHMKEAPPAPRPAQIWATQARAQPLLPPLPSKSRRRSSSHKERKSSKSSSSQK